MLKMPMTLLVGATLVSSYPGYAQEKPILLPGNESQRLICDGKYTEAVSALKKVVSEKPEFAEAHFVLAQAELLAGKTAQSRQAFLSAKQAFDERVRTNSGSVGDRLQSAVVTAALGNLKEALSKIRKLKTDHATDLLLNTVDVSDEPSLVRYLRKVLSPVSLCGASLAVDARPEDILIALYPDEDLQLVEQKSLYSDSNHKFKMTSFVRGDFNRDRKPDLAFCATGSDRPDRSRDGYLFIVTRETDGWTSVFRYEWKNGAAPGLQWDDKNKRLFSTLSHTGENPLEVRWSATSKTYTTSEVPWSTLLKKPKPGDDEL